MQYSAYHRVIPSVLLVLLATPSQCYNISDIGVLDVSDYSLVQADNTTDLNIDTGDDTDDNLVDIDGDNKAPIDTGRRKGECYCVTSQSTVISIVLECYLNSTNRFLNAVCVIQADSEADKIFFCFN